MDARHLNARIGVVVVAALAVGVAIGALYARAAGRNATDQHAVQGRASGEGSAAVPVELASASPTTIPSYAEATGTVKARTQVDIAPKIMSTIRTVAVREGDHVARGQVLVTLDSRDLQAQAAQAEAGLRAAASQVQAARTAAELQRSQTAVGIAQAQAALDAAKQQLAIVRQGPRRQQRAQAELQVAQAEATFRNAEIEYQRMDRLYKEEVVPKQRLDAARTQYEVAKAALEAAKQQADLVQEGSRQEEIRAAEEQVRTAEEALRLAKASAAQNELREQQARAAAAEASRAAAALKLSLITEGYSRLVSPVNGVVVARHADPGDMVAPGTPILTIEETGRHRLEATVPESQISALKVGQRVHCIIDALGPRPVAGHVDEIVPAGDPGSHTFLVKVALPPSPGLKSGLFGRLRFPIGSQEAVTVPSQAVWERGGVTGVFVMDRGGIARVRLIKVGSSMDGRVEVLSGLSGGETVVTTGIDRLSDGMKVVTSSGERASAKLPTVRMLSSARLALSSSRGN